MAIVPLDKVTLFGMASQKSAVLDRLQELGCMHLVSLQNASGPVPRPDALADAMKAQKFLESCPLQGRPRNDAVGFSFDEVVSEALTIERRQQELEAERDQLRQAIGPLLPWGDFRLPSEDELNGLRLWFYPVPHYRLDTVRQATTTWYVAARDHRFAYVVVLQADEPMGMPVACVPLDRRPLSELKRLLEAVEKELEELFWQRVRLSSWREQLSLRIGLAEDRAARQRAAQQAWEDSDIFAVRGWVPRSQTGPVTAFAGAQGLAVTVDKPQPGETPPTLLSNHGLAAGGEPAVSFYTTPPYDAWDPSGMVFVSFCVFFAMIMADAGYALLLGVVVLLLWPRLGRSAARVRIRKLFMGTAVASVVYGVIVGSYFGFAPREDSLLGRLHVIDAGDMTLMMQISVSVGVAHLVVANLAAAWSRRWSLLQLSPVGWAVVLVGGLALGLGKSGVEPAHALIQSGGWAIVGGIAAILLFSSERPLLTLNAKTHGRRFLDGVISLASVSRAFGDVLSYLRLFALGLASAQLAATFNELVYQASCCVGVGSLLAVVAVVFGHGLNFLLVIMSGVVHGLRLNCIEFFGWGFAGEGYPFKPFYKRTL